mmetsp:Transcript_37871/g.93751  ORF Transcript_37871/g.93751 Transcript_37871/m.93751 type:complete len:177 (-) Transcript_37871:81-611(-)
MLRRRQGLRLRWGCTGPGRGGGFYTQAVKQGNAYAQYELANCYREGIGSAKNEVDAARLYAKAAEQGLAQARHYLGACYERGVGLAQDVTAGVIYHNAQYDCGIIYHNGIGVPQDHETAARFYRQAADQGLADAQLASGECCMLGAGVAHDLPDVARYIRLAVKTPVNVGVARPST